MQVPVSAVAGQLQELGIDRGWGGNVGRIRSTMLMLGDIIQAPDPETLQASPASLPEIDASSCMRSHSSFPGSSTFHELKNQDAASSSGNASALSAVKIIGLLCSLCGDV